MAAADLTTTWLKQHAAGEKLLAKVLRRYFKAQTGRIVAAMKDNAITAASVPLIFDADAEHTALMEVVAEPVIGMMATGAERVMATATTRRTRPKAAKAYDPSTFDFERFTLPDYVQQAIRAAWLEIESKDWWADIQASTAERLTKIIGDSITAGDNGRKMMKAVKAALGETADVRADAIARTETTGAYNAGHEAAYTGLEADGVQLTRKWMSIIDGSTRESHAAANGQAADAGTKEFTVGGEQCRFPGDPGLSAESRCNCRCTTIADFGDEEG